MNEMLEEIVGVVTSASWLEQSATVLGVLGVVLAIRQKIWNFPVGLVQVSLSAVVFYQARLYADMKLQGFFFIVLCYGWWHWSRPSEGRKELPVTTLTGVGRLSYFAVGVLGTALWGWYLREATDAAMPFRDAFVGSFGVLSQWLQARKKLENWIGWMLVNASAVGVCWLSGLYWFTVLYAIFFGLAIAGYREWLQSNRQVERAS